MADNVSNQIKNLDQWIKNADKSLKNLLDTYNKFEARASARSTRSFNVEERKKLNQDISTTQTKIKTLTNEIRKLLQTANNPKEIAALNKALLDLSKSSASFNTVMTTLNRSRRATTALSSRFASSQSSAMTAFARLNIASTYNNGAAAANNFSRSAKNAKSSLESMLPTLRRLGGAFGVAFSVQGLVNFGKKLVETRGEFELQQVALRSILQNKQLADEIWDKTMKAALQSPFTAMQLTKYTKQLAAYRIETDKLFDTTKRLADVSAGLGVDMQRLILAYGQVKAANYLRASEIRQFTEAGVNVLGELRDYFNDVKGMSVDTAKVMDMVQKRLVTFSDVEAIFKRMTDQGGIFYNMQYVQSQTVKGQINKLHDAYDQMLNSIGKANEGAIKNMVSLLNNIVKNWREWKTVLDTIAWQLMITSVIKFGRGLLTVGSSARIAAGEIKGLELAGTKLRNFIGKTNPWMALATAVTAATFALINHVKAVRATQKEIDEQNLRLYETKELMSGYQKTLEENNKAIKEGKLSEDELSKKRKENSGIIAKLKEQYPDIVRGLDLERDGTDKLTESLKNYNDELERRMTLQNMLGTGGGWFSDTVRDNMQQWETDLSDLKGQLLSVQSNARGGMMKMELKGEQDSPLYSELKKISELDLSDVIKASKEYEDILERIFSAPMRDARWDIDPNANYISKGIDIYGFRLLQLEQFPHDIKQVSKESNIAFKNFITSLEHDFESSVSNIKEYSDKISQEYGNDVLRFIANNTDLINQGVLDGNADVVKTIRTVLQSAGVGLTEESRKFYNQLLNERILYLKYQEALNDAEEKSFFRRTQNAMEARKSYVPIDFFATPASSSTADPTSGTKNNGNKAKESVSAMISLIKEMNSEYGKLSKSAYGFAKSQDKVTDSFRESFEQIFRVRGGKGTYINYDDIDFTNKAGAAKALHAVFDQIENANAWGKFAKNAKDEMMKAISGLEVEADIEVKTRIREDFGRQMEDAFNDYDLTLELQNLGISEDMAKNLFPDLDYTSIGKLQEIMKDFYDSRQTKDEKGNVLFSVKDLEEYRKWADKIDAEILKARKEKVKQYSKYLEKEYSERAKLEMKHAQDIAFVTANITDEAQRKNIIENINRKYQNDLNDLNWRSFKESDFYVEMMDDISSLPREYMQMMLDKIEEILQHPETLSPRALKEAINARQKVLEAQMNLEPLDVMRSSLTTIREAQQDKEVGGKNWKQTKENINKAVAEQAELIQGYDNEIQRLQTLQGELAGYEKALENLQNADLNVDIPLLNRVLGLDAEGKITSMEDLSDDAIQGYIDRLTTENAKEKAKYDATVQTDEMNARAVEISDRERIIKLLTDELTARRELSNYQMSDAATTAVATGQTSTSVGSEIQVVQGKKDTSVKKIQNFKQYLKAFTQFDAAFAKFNAAINSTLNAVAGMGNAFYDMFDALGGKTDALTEGWKEFGNTMISSITNALTMIPMMVAAFTAAGIAINSAMGIIGLIAEALNLLMTAITAISKLHDAGYEKEIENQQKKIDELKSAYERLEKAIEKTWTTMSYIDTYNQQVQNIREQIDAMEAQMRAEEAKKNTDDNAVRQYQRDIQDAYDQLDELEQKSIEVFGGIGEEGYRSAAEGFVDAWKSAFLETGDGLQGLQDHFDEFLQDWFEKQATMRIAGRMLEPMMSMIDQSVDDGILTRMELDRIKERASEIFPQLNEQLREFYETMGFGDAYGSLSGLAQSISGMTEEQADILAAYWNSVRMYVASMDVNVAAIANALGIGEGSPNTNPMLQQLTIIARNTSSIYTLIDSVVLPGHSKGRSGIKIFLN